jgi:hypothetical protein
MERTYDMFLETITTSTFVLYKATYVQEFRVHTALEKLPKEAVQVLGVVYYYRYCSFKVTPKYG